MFDLRALLEDLELMFRMRADAKLEFTLDGLACPNTSRGTKARSARSSSTSSATP
jgi:hypothetical protein